MEEPPTSGAEGLPVAAVGGGAGDAGCARVGDGPVALVGDGGLPPAAARAPEGAGPGAAATSDGAKTTTRPSTRAVAGIEQDAGSTDAASPAWSLLLRPPAAAGGSPSLAIVG